MLLSVCVKSNSRVVHGLDEVLTPGRPEAANAFFPPTNQEAMGGWVNPYSRYGIQFRYHNAELMAQHHRDYAIGSIASYVYHGSDCPIIHGLKTRYNSLVRQKMVFLPQSVHSFIRVCVIILQRQSRDKHRET